MGPNFRPWLEMGNLGSLILGTKRVKEFEKKKEAKGNNNLPRRREVFKPLNKFGGLNFF